MLSNCGACGAWTANQSILEDINLEYSLEGLILKLKLQYFGHLMQKNWLIGKDSDAGKDRRQEEKGTREDEMVEWHHWCNGLELGQIPGNGEGQRGLECCNPQGDKESDTTRWLSKNNIAFVRTTLSESPSVVSDSLWPYGLYSPWNSPGQNTGVGSHSFLQGIFPTILKYNLPIEKNQL